MEPSDSETDMDNSELFNELVTLPHVWAMQAMHLRRASDYLYGTCKAAWERAISREIQAALSGPQEVSASADTLSIESEDGKDVDMVPVVYMLVGLSLETICKAILVGRNEFRVSTTGKVEGAKTHNLKTLFLQCGIAVDAPESDILLKLTSYIQWMGKYPVPLDQKDMRPPKIEADWMPTGNFDVRENMKATADVLFDRARSVFLTEEYGRPGVSHPAFT